MKKLILLTVVLLSGCGSFPLGNYQGLQGQTRSQADQDLLFCEHWSKNETDTSTRVAASFVAGMTIVGAPIAIHSARERQRELWRQCMTDRGYAVTPPQ